VQEICELTHNYRNSLPIARLAKEFFTDDPASPPISLPKSVPGDKIPRMVRYGGDLEVDINRVAIHILRVYDRDIDKLICVITPNDAVRNKFCQSLHSIAQSQPFDHDVPNIQTYCSNQNITSVDGQDKHAAIKCPICGAQMLLKKNRTDGGLFWGCSMFSSGCKHTKRYVDINFKNGGIAVINQQSIKGLEFDIVYIADIDLFYAKDKDGLMKKFYVMTSRARDELFLFRTGNISPKVDEIIPHDETILRKG
jgi:DNA-directed RNA polymerase subunit RPC12/RpoP